MSTGTSVHIGLNAVDPVAFSGPIVALQGAINDARAMRALAERNGYTVGAELHDRQATATAVLAAIRSAIEALDAGGTLLVTFAGHGSQIVDLDFDELHRGRTDGRDETWVLYDRMLLDDELAELWATMPRGTRVIVVSDSCHSGTVTRDLIAPRTRALPEAVSRAHVSSHQSVYSGLLAARAAPPPQRPVPVALLAACKDDQVSIDNDRHGAFTEALLEVWAGGAFTGTLRELQHAVGRAIRTPQSPVLTRHGPRDSALDAAPAFRPAP